MTTPLSLPSPHEPFVDLQTGKVSEIWYRYLNQSLISNNQATTVELTTTTPLSISTANVLSITFPYATQANEETGTSTTAIITPSVQQFHPSAAKAWGYVTMAGTVATIAAGYNVGAVSSTTTGVLTVGLTTPFSSTNYSVVPGLTHVNTGLNAYSVLLSTLGLATTQFTLVVLTATGATLTPSAYQFVCYGDQ